MKCTIGATVAIALISSVMQAAPAVAQVPSDLQNPQIEIVYAVPSDAKFKPIYDRLKQRQVLEQLALFLSPLRLPSKLTLKADQCGALTVAYKTASPVTICYEYIARIEEVAPGDANVIVGPGLSTKENRGFLRRDDLLVGPVVMVALHEVALAVFDILQVPVWGMKEDAADRIAGFMMAQFGKDVAWKTLLGTGWYLSQSGITGLGVDFYYVRTLDGRRFYNYLCMAYASDHQTFAFLVRNADLPENRAAWCDHDYEQVRLAFQQTILPYVDQDVLKKVQALKWLEAAKPQ